MRISEMSFSASYDRLMGTTGYTPNPNVWKKIELQQQKQLQQQLFNHKQHHNFKTSERKRKKWLQDFNGVRDIYRISEDEGEEIKLPVVIKSKILAQKKENLRRKKENYPEHASWSKFAELTPVPQIVVSKDTASVCDESEVMHEIPTSEVNQCSLLKPPVIRPQSPVFIRDDSSLQRVQRRQTVKKADISRYAESPMYMHIHVPRRTQIRHVSEESIDLPLLLPKMKELESHNGFKQRKPVTVSLSQNLVQAKAAVRKKWNIPATKEPFRFFTAPLPINSAYTKQSEEELNFNSHNLENTGDSLNILKKEVQWQCDNNSDRENIPKFQNDCKSCKRRQKWVLPDFWPSQNTVLDGPASSCVPVQKPGVKMPKKSKRMAARLDGHSSNEVDSSKSVSDSAEKRTPPPLPPRKSEEKIARKAAVQKSIDDRTKKTNVSQTRKSSSDVASRQDIQKPSPDPAVTSKSDGSKSASSSGQSRDITEQKVVADLAKKQDADSELDKMLTAGGANTTMSSSVSVASSQDDTPMLQKLKDMNKKEQNSSRKKEMPKWLKQEDISTPFENPPVSRDGARSQSVKEQKSPRTQEEINMLIDEEMSNFADQKPSSGEPEHAVDTSDNCNTPMKRIQKNRSKWRENPNMNLEESWGSLSQFNKCQRGRLSFDMDDDVLDEYINKAAKLAGLPTEPDIPEETTVDQTSDRSIDMDDDNFVIPELPYGQELIINIRSTWGDKHYVGLTGIEVFSSSGEQVTISAIRAEPSDINVLPEYSKDPRVVKNLIDGTNRTRDDIHMWLAPFTSGRDHLVFCSFVKPCKVALIRIWNYNKSRIHSYRGAKDVTVTLDSSLIFKGEIARACGGIEGGTEAFGDTILFTTDEGILEAVSQNDEAFEGEMLSDDEPFDVERPSTADIGDKERPFTRAVGSIKALERELTVAYEGNMMVYRGKCLELNFVATWGDHHYLGLTGLEVVGTEGDAIPLNINMISASPQDVRSLPGHERDDRTLDKLIDGSNITISDEHMWLIPFVDGNNHTVVINFGEKVFMAGLRIWNYNKSKEDTYRGARILHVAIDEKVISPPEGFLVRKGPGNCHFDYAQEISFSPQSWNTAGLLSVMGQSPATDESQNYEVVQMPCGFIYQLQLFSTWGDAYYVGLNGLELYDGDLKKIVLTESNISAYPDSVNVLENISNDVRTPDKLIDGVNDTMDGGHIWLAPILPGHLNRVYVIFDQPTSISMIKIWNYSKTSGRGVKDFALLVDDLLVYNGVLQAVPQTARGILPNCEGPQPYHTILFTGNKDILKKEKHTIINNQAGEQDVQMTNDKKIVNHYNDPKKAQLGKPVDQKLRPTTGVIHSKKRR